LGRRGEVADGGREIVVGALLAVDEAADFGEDAAEVDGVGFAEKTAGLTEVEDAELAAGFEDAEEFAEAGLVVGEIAKAEGGDD
jgi:hypothetical protein